MPAPCSTRQKDTSGLPPTPVTVDLPTFSMAVTLNLNKGALDGRAWRNLVGETANYYILVHEFALGNSASSCCRSRSDKDCFHHLTLALHLSLCCESDVQESIFMSLIFRFLLMVSLNRRRGRPLFL